MLVFMLSACGAEQAIKTVVPVTPVEPVVVTSEPIYIVVTATPQSVVTAAPVVESTQDNRVDFMIGDWRVVKPEVDWLFGGHDFNRKIVIFNAGSQRWGRNFKLVSVGKTNYGYHKTVTNVAVLPNEFGEFTVALHSPEEGGTYTEYFMMETDTGELFGCGLSNEPIAVTFKVGKPK